MVAEQQWSGYCSVQLKVLVLSNGTVEGLSMSNKRKGFTVGISISASGSG